MNMTKKQPDATDKAPQKLPQPESLEAKFKLLLLLPHDGRAKRKHCLVFGFVVDWHHSKYGNALASVRHIVEHLRLRGEQSPSGQPLYTGAVHSALRDLVDWGYLASTPGKGRAASRYIPVWDLVCAPRSVPISPNTNENRSVPVSANAGVPVSPNATPRSVPISPNQDPLTGPGDKTRGLKEGTAAPMPPPDGATTANAAVDEFEQLWLAYGVKRKRVEAKAAFLKVSALADYDHAATVAAALAWRERWQAQGDPSAPRKALSTWLAEEQYRCDPPAGYAPKKAKTKKTRKEAVVAKKTDPVEIMVCNGSFEKRHGIWTIVVEIVLPDDSGEALEFCVDSRYRNDVDFGMALLSELCVAIDVSGPTAHGLDTLATQATVESWKRAAVDGLDPIVYPISLGDFGGICNATRTDQGWRFGDWKKNKVTKPAAPAARNDNHEPVGFEDAYDNEVDQRQEYGDGYGY